MHTQYYAIRHKRNGFFLPAQNSYGFTRTEPVPMSKAPPRLFITKGPATQALEWWLKGEVFESAVDNLESVGPEREITLRTVPKPGRRREDMEIVVIRLQVETLNEAALRLL